VGVPVGAEPTNQKKNMATAVGQRLLRRSPIGLMPEG
jgi:hypothetical protein